jgi:hypothetical protein
LSGQDAPGTARFTTTFKKPGAYCVYAQAGRGNPPPALSVRVEHATGQSESGFGQWMPSSATSQSGWIYLGTYSFNEKGTVRFATVGTNTARLPEAVLFMEER